MKLITALALFLGTNQAIQLRDDDGFDLPKLIDDHDVELDKVLAQQQGQFQKLVKTDTPVLKQFEQQLGQALRNSA